MIRDRVTAFEKCVLIACLYDFETGALLARGSLRLKNVTDTFISAATSDLDVEIKLRWFYEQEFSSSVKGSRTRLHFSKLLRVSEGVGACWFSASIYSYLSECIHLWQEQCMPGHR